MHIQPPAHVHDWLHRSWDWVNHIVEKLSVTQTAALGGAGSVASAGSALSLDVVSSGLNLFILIGSAIGVVLSVGLMMLKVVQQRREMAAFIEAGKREVERMKSSAAVATGAAATAATAAAITARQAVKTVAAQAEERQDLQARVADLEAKAEEKTS